MHLEHRENVNPERIESYQRHIGEKVKLRITVPIHKVSNGGYAPVIFINKKKICTLPSSWPKSTAELRAREVRELLKRATVGAE